MDDLTDPNELDGEFEEPEGTPRGSLFTDLAAPPPAPHKVSRSTSPASGPTSSIASSSSAYTT